MPCLGSGSVQRSATDLLSQARTALPDLNDASLMDRALAALCAEHRAAEIDRSYQVFHDVPLDTEDEWGNLAEFLEAAGSA